MPISGPKVPETPRACWVIAVLAWAMIVVGAMGELFFGLIYFFFCRED